MISFQRPQAWKVGYFTLFFNAARHINILFDGLINNLVWNMISMKPTSAFIFWIHLHVLNISIFDRHRKDSNMIFQSMKIGLNQCTIQLSINSCQMQPNKPDNFFRFFFMKMNIWNCIYYFNLWIKYTHLLSLALSKPLHFGIIVIHSNFIGFL